MNPSPTKSAIAAAAKEIEEVVANTINPRALIREIITRHVEPIVRVVEEERDQFQANYCAEQMISESLPSHDALRQVIAERDQALAKLAEVEGEAITNRLALALWMSGGTPNQPLIDDIERWRQEVAARVYQDEAVKAALTRAEQSEALLARVWQFANEEGLSLGGLGDDITAHLAPKETT